MVTSPSPLGEFLRARRELAHPETFDLADAGHRRVAGLRREEVAMLAGISADYYIRMEQGRERHPSSEVVNGLARVFELDDHSTNHLRQLAAAASAQRRSQPRPARLPDGLRILLNAWSGQAVLVQTRFRDVLACTPLAAAMHPGLEREQNMLRLLFLHAEARDLYRDWDEAAREAVAWLRSAAGTDVDDPRLAALVGELSVQSPQFARLWARHDVQVKSSGTRRVNHPAIGEITVRFDTFTVNEDPTLSLSVYHAEPGTPDADKLTLLAGTVSADDDRDVIVFGPTNSTLPRRASTSQALNARPR